MTKPIRQPFDTKPKTPIKSILRRVFGRDDRTLVIYDGAYLMAISKSIDMIRFERLVRFYSGTVPRKSAWFGTRSPSRNDDLFMDTLLALKIEPFNFRLANRTATCHNCNHTREVLIQKGVDVGIAIYAMRELHKDSFDKLIFIGGDGDFTELIEEIRASGKTVYVMGTEDTVAEGLRLRATKMIELGPLLPMCQKGHLGERETWSWSQMEQAIPTR